MQSGYIVTAQLTPIKSTDPGRGHAVTDCIHTEFTLNSAGVPVSRVP